MDLSQKTVLITGASGNIGRHLAAYFASRDAFVVLTGRDEDRLQQAAAEMPADRVMRVAADLSEAASIRALVDALHVRDRQVDILINNAADVTSKAFLESSFEEIDAQIRTNVVGALQLTRLLVPGMVEHGGGAIVNVSSLAGYKANPSQTVYSISKTAVNGMSEALRAELGGKGIAVINVALSSVALSGPVQGGQVPVAAIGPRLEQAIEQGETEIFFSARTKWLMRLYAAFPGLKRLR